jgi:hypothetical protein
VEVTHEQIAAFNRKDLVIYTILLNLKVFVKNFKQFCIVINEFRELGGLNFDEVKELLK